MKYWQASNRDYAEQSAFNQAIGYLQGRKSGAEQISIDEILNYMKATAKEICEQLNKDFPEHAEQ